MCSQGFIKFRFARTFGQLLAFNTFFNGFKNQCFLLTLATNQSDAGAAQGDEGNDAGAFMASLLILSGLGQISR